MSTIAVRVDDQLKDDATELFQSLGLDMSTAVKMFLIQSVKTQSIPFEIKNKSFISDEEFQKLVELKSKGIRVRADDPESVKEFFGDEDFSEYEEYFKWTIQYYDLENKGFNIKIIGKLSDRDIKRLKDFLRVEVYKIWKRSFWVCCY